MNPTPQFVSIHRDKHQRNLQFRCLATGFPESYVSLFGAGGG
jgi:hypothetical protein